MAKQVFSIDEVLKAIHRNETVELITYNCIGDEFFCKGNTGWCVLNVGRKRHQIISSDCYQKIRPYLVQGSKRR